PDSFAGSGYENDFVPESKFHVVCLSWESDSTSSEKVSDAKYVARGSVAHLPILVKAIAV
ncbi:MAG TPA: hypothetical protein VF772_18090, partial [Terriglobales bacterium]